MRAISPVIATLLMIAIAVVASLVTYAWVMGYMNFTTEKTGKAIQIQSIAYPRLEDRPLPFMCKMSAIQTYSLSNTNSCIHKRCRHATTERWSPSTSFR